MIDTASILTIETILIAYMIQIFEASVVITTYSHTVATKNKFFKRFTKVETRKAAAITFSDSYKIIGFKLSLLFFL